MELTISDTGSGIPKHITPKIFAKPYRNSDLASRIREILDEKD